MILFAKCAHSAKLARNPHTYSNYAIVAVA
jgi:hypothetical protein